MKALMTLVLSTLFLQSIFAQVANSTESNDSTNIYYQSLIKYCDYLESLNIDKKTLYLEENALVTKGIPSEIGRFEIKCLNIDQLREAAKGEEGIQLIRVVQLRVKEGQFFVNIIPFKVTYKKKNFSFINSGGEKIVYEYDKETKKFIFKEIRHGSI